MIYLFLIITSIIRVNTGNPVELGKVHWLRSMDEAVSRSKTECKPILILFQEVPGCETCRQYGNEVLSHPLIVEAIETLYVPLAIYNNKGGHDAEILKKFNEPSWNNPVVRIVNDKGADVTSRLSGNYSALGLTEMMINALIKSHGKAPVYLQLLADELAAKKRGTQLATYSMHCFWSGEALFGNLNGVIATTAGWKNGREVVKVEYDPVIISRSQLDKVSAKLSCKNADQGAFAQDKTPKYYLSNHAYRSIPMTELQKTRVNAALAERQSPDEFLSPRQLGLLNKNSTANYVSIPLAEAWKNVN